MYWLYILNILDYKLDFKMKNFRIRLQLEGGQWTYWLNKDQLERYREDQIKAVVIEETMSYQQYLKYMESKNV